MSTPTFARRENLEVIEEYYRRWNADPASVDDRWQAFFEGFELAGSRPALSGDDTSQTDIVRLVMHYRNIGHLQAHLDPLSDKPDEHPLLALAQCGLSEKDLDRTFDCSAFHGMKNATLRELVTALTETYCNTVGVEYMHIQDTAVREWIKARIEPRRMRPNLSEKQKRRTLMMTHYAEAFERFLHTRYQGQKRFSLEGAETLIPVLDAIIEKSPSLGAKEFVIGMAHRGRLNVLANILRKPYQNIFAEFEDNFLPDSIDGDGDVKYHLGYSSTVDTADGKRIHLSLTPNPSHLEAVNPVVEGRTRAKQRSHQDNDRTAGVPLLIHGDAAFAGQGVVAETLNLANLEGYTTGGTVHVIVNNQIGFTTSPVDSRSTTYCSDVAKMIQAPIFHVNGEDVEACVFIAELAIEFRQTFKRDVVIDMYCYRRHGHNEGDEPAFTQPLMYAKIKNRPGVSAIYTEKLIAEGSLERQEGDELAERFQNKLDTAQREMRESAPGRRGMSAFSGTWKSLQPKYHPEPKPTKTNSSIETLKQVITHLTTVPAGVTVNPKVTRLLEQRRENVHLGRNIDWATAEALAFGSLLVDGHSVRLTGQDCRRGTFSQRHASLTDANNGKRYVLFDGLAKEPAYFVVYDSLLSEEAVLGFEFGFSLDAPLTLVLWEAQFGDFVNGAQSIIDQFIVCSESKWQRSSGIVMLLPHGYEGQGPEHSSGRMERFLQSCAEDNIQVCNLSTPSQYYHALRRQMKRDFRKPLVIMTPKSLLRHKECVSAITDFTDGHFREVIDDTTPRPDRIRRVVMCSGKIYYELLEKRTKDDVAIVRLEQFYPFPENMLREALSRYNGAEMVWVQEESQNMGGWGFVEPRLRAMGHNVSYIGRDASASPAVGSLKIHQREQGELIEAALFGNSGPHVIGSAKRPETKQMSLDGHQTA
ncbi:2-oxoglutarate dehydrogenase E1 component [Zavarzinella formosa]|uniref:2-oxoglutarate dehydrogenase E1 component n=1 Tax=Zavarzinella formosa TaxID=360055 RepID=UPI000301E4BD|nr:2-oxoglutarate dehydrogenase E1 component [Zavarzinella formosa]